jgi:hypothetical protein
VFAVNAIQEEQMENVCFRRFFSMTSNTTSQVEVRRLQIITPSTYSRSQLH